MMLHCRLSRALHCSIQGFYSEVTFIKTTKRIILFIHWSSQLHVTNTLFKTHSFLGSFEKLRKATMSCVMSVCLSVCQPLRPSARTAQLDYPRKNFHKIWCLIIFRKSVQKIHVSLKSNNKRRLFTWRQIFVFNHMSLGLLRMRHFSDKRCRENQNTLYAQ